MTIVGGTFSPRDRLQVVSETAVYVAQLPWFAGFGIAVACARGR